MAATAPACRVTRALAGELLHGDDFGPEELEAWYADEREGYFALYGGAPGGDEGRPYTYEAVAQRHGWRWLGQRRYRHALGIGSAHGAELRPVLDRSEQVTVLEPADGFEATHIDGKPVRYVKPQASGRMPFDDASFDLIVCFSVLHHVPNVSTVLRECARVLRPGGDMLLREPTHSLGDWRAPRPGLTPRERGIPVRLFRRMIAEAGLSITRETRCMFPLLGRLSPWLGRPVWTSPLLARLDAWLCALPIWPDVYHATHAWQKLRPSSVAYVLRKDSHRPRRGGAPVTEHRHEPNALVHSGPPSAWGTTFCHPKSLR